MIVALRASNGPNPVHMGAGLRILLATYKRALENALRFNVLYRVVMET